PQFSSPRWGPLREKLGSMCPTGMRVAIGLLWLMACGGRAKDETRVSEPAPTPQTSIGTAQPDTNAVPQVPGDGGCEPGSSRCNGSLLEVCSREGTSWL